MRTYFQNFLAFLARKIIKKYKPTIIGITGSVGKTSAKEAVFAVVSQKFSARKPEKNFNNEIGLPLTVLGIKSPGRNILKWLAAIARAIALWLLPMRYPEVLVLEMGVDRPGDMDHLISIAKPHIGVITSIGVSHYEFFQSLKAIEREKGKIAGCLSENDWLVVNGDDPVAVRQMEKSKARSISYGENGNAGVTVQMVNESFEGSIGTNIAVKTPTKNFEVAIPAVGQAHILSAACAIAVAEAMGMEATDIATGLKTYRPAPGRLNVIKGIKQSVLIDDTYNAAPHSMLSAVSLLNRIPGELKVAVLGDMLELGAISEEQHQNVGKLIASIGVHKLVTVGLLGRAIGQSAISHGMDVNNVYFFSTSNEAKRFVQEIMKPRSVVLIKGSQGVRMEKITKEVMAEPEFAAQVLCRQYGKWLQEN